MVIFRLIAAKACGIISRPDWIGVNPSPTWYRSGNRKGIPPMPSRVKKLPLTAARKVRMRNRTQAQQGMRGLRRMQAVTRQAETRKAPEAPKFRAQLSVCSPNTSSTYESSATPEPNRIRPTISSGSVCLAIVRQMLIDEIQARSNQSEYSRRKSAANENIRRSGRRRSGPSMGPIKPGIATKLMARTSSDLAKVRTIVSRPTGTIMAPPQPCKMRNATSSVDVGRYAAEKRSQA